MGRSFEQLRHLLGEPLPQQPHHSPGEVGAADVVEPLAAQDRERAVREPAGHGAVEGAAAEVVHQEGAGALDGTGQRGADGRLRFGLEPHRVAGDSRLFRGRQHVLVARRLPGHGDGDDDALGPSRCGVRGEAAQEPQHLRDQFEGRAGPVAERGRRRLAHVALELAAVVERPQPLAVLGGRAHQELSLGPQADARRYRGDSGQRVADADDGAVGPAHHDGRVRRAEVDAVGQCVAVRLCRSVPLCGHGCASPSPVPPGLLRWAGTPSAPAR